MIYALDSILEESLLVLYVLDHLNHGMFIEVVS